MYFCQAANSVYSNAYCTGLSSIIHYYVSYSLSNGRRCFTLDNYSHYLHFSVYHSVCLCLLKEWYENGFKVQCSQSKVWHLYKPPSQGNILLQSRALCKTCFPVPLIYMSSTKKKILYATIFFYTCFRGLIPLSWSLKPLRLFKKFFF